MKDEVAIVGAGPAGAWAAFQLARRGARVRLFDSSHPREKPCGGGLTGRALRIIDDLAPLEGPDALPAVAIRSTCFLDTPGGRSVSVAIGDPGSQPALVVVSRATFDSRLLDAARDAGAELVRDRVVDVQSARGGFHVLTASRQKVRTPFLIGADGVNSLVRRRLAGAFRRRELSVATGFFAHGRSSDQIAVELVSSPPGYIWSFPRRDHLAIGICAEIGCGRSAGALRAQAAGWIRATGIGNGARLEPYAWPIPSLSRNDLKALTASGPGWMLIGDAAGLVDPITREGLYYALSSAEHATAALLSSARPEADYASRLRGEIIPELCRAAALKAGFFRPRFRALMMDALSTSTAIQRVMADLVAGTQAYHGLRRRLARTGELRLAWRWLMASTAIPHGTE